MKPVLLLGGTADARHLAAGLHAQKIPFIYSVAGLVRQPAVSGEVISGGFSQRGGLAAFIKRRGIVAIVNAVHPFASKMTEEAEKVSVQCKIPYWRFLRPAWQIQAGDQWVSCEDWHTIAAQMLAYKNVLFTAGQLPQRVLDHIKPEQQAWMRTAVVPKTTLPVNCQWIKAIGPFDIESERQLFVEHKIDVLVSKNSGGMATYAKIAVARQLSLPILMLDRPQVEFSASTYADLKDCLSRCAEWYYLAVLLSGTA